MCDYGTGKVYDCHSGGWNFMHATQLFFVI